MKAHIFHDDEGAIRSLLIQNSEVQGELEVKMEQEEGSRCMIVDLAELLPEIEGEREIPPPGQLFAMTREIPNRFRVSRGRELERIER